MKSLLRVARIATAEGPHLSADTQRHLWALATRQRDHDLAVALIGRADAPGDLLAEYRDLTNPAKLRAAYLSRPDLPAGEVTEALAAETRLAVLVAIAGNRTISDDARVAVTRAHPRIIDAITDNLGTDPAPAVARAVAVAAAAVWDSLTQRAQHTIRDLVRDADTVDAFAVAAADAGNSAMAAAAHLAALADRVVPAQVNDAYVTRLLDAVAKLGTNGMLDNPLRQYLPAIVLPPDAAEHLLDVARTMQAQTGRSLSEMFRTTLTVAAAARAAGDDTGPVDLDVALAAAVAANNVAAVNQLAARADFGIEHHQACAQLVSPAVLFTHHADDVDLVTAAVRSCEDYRTYDLPAEAAAVPAAVRAGVVERLAAAEPNRRWPKTAVKFAATGWFDDPDVFDRLPLYTILDAPEHSADRGTVFAALCALIDTETGGDPARLAVADNLLAAAGAVTTVGDLRGLLRRLTTAAAAS